MVRVAWRESGIQQRTRAQSDTGLLFFKATQEGKEEKEKGGAGGRGRGVRYARRGATGQGRITKKAFLLFYHSAPVTHPEHMGNRQR